MMSKTAGGLRKEIVSGRLLVFLPEGAFSRGMSTLTTPKPGVDYATLLKGASVDVIAARDKVTVDALARVADVFYKQPISSDPTKASVVGGEVVRNIHEADAEHDVSMFRMYFSGTQRIHTHPGPRSLVVGAPNEWTFYSGGLVLNPNREKPIEVLAVKMPPGVAHVRIPKGMVHGFEGEELFATSMHHTDLEELEEARKASGDPHLMPDDKDIMRWLTFDWKDALKVVVDEVDYHDLPRLMDRSAHSR